MFKIEPGKLGTAQQLGPFAPCRMSAFILLFIKIIKELPQFNCFFKQVTQVGYPCLNNLFQ